MVAPADRASLIGATPSPCGATLDYSVPTTKPRYTFTDTGELERMLDLAQRAWPEVDDRKELLYRLARTGEAAVREQVQERELDVRRERQREALERGAQLIDADVLLADAAWR
jgi:hypothetical protein